MNAAAASSEASPQEPPDLAIRARTPSPKRLSRKVLLGGAIILGAIIAFALLIGLSEQGPRGGAPSETAPASAGPPETIQSASAQYEAGDLTHGVTLDDDPLWGDERGGEEASLSPPADSTWSGANAAGGGPAASAPAQPNPQEVARSAPILFSSGEPTAREAANDDRLDAQLSPPRSRYELLAGAVIPAALSTELNSDLPGRVIAQVTAPVFDSVTGNHLLIPQGSRLIGTYDNGVRYGDQRILLVWNRLILPNGWSLNLQGMQGSDPAGAAGLTDRTDRHFDRLIGAIGLSAIISVVANNAEDDDENVSLVQDVGNAAAQEAARSGGRIVDRELSVRPTLRVRAGAPVRVLVMRDIQLRPYRDTANVSRR